MMKYFSFDSNGLSCSLTRPMAKLNQTTVNALILADQILMVFKYKSYEIYYFNQFFIRKDKF